MMRGTEPRYKLSARGLYPHSWCGKQRRRRRRLTLCWCSYCEQGRVPWNGV